MAQPTEKQLRAVVDELSKKMVDQGKLIEAGWVSFLMLVVGTDAPEVQQREMRIAFFAGAQHLFGSIMSVLDEDAEVTDTDLSRMDLIATEIKLFAEQLRLQLQRPQGRS